MENQTGIPDNQDEISNPNDRKKKIIRWVVIGVATLFLLIALAITWIMIAIVITSKNLKKQTAQKAVPITQEATPVPSMKNAMPSSGPKPDANNTFARKDLFYDLAATQMVRAVVCADESALNPDSPGAGKAICLDTAVSADIYSAVDPGICDGDNYAIAITDLTSEDGIFQCEFSCNINGEPYKVLCSENGCKR
jgi:hypothetical protein